MASLADRIGTSQTPTKRAEDIRPGDIILFLGQPHLISSVESYSGPFDFILGIARAANGWGMSLESDARITVAQ